MPTKEPGVDVDPVALRHAVLRLPELNAWPEVAALFPDGQGSVRVDWRLRVLACLAAGGFVEAALPAAAAVACLQMSIMLVDDVLDEDPRGAYRYLGHGKTANLALALPAAALKLLDRAPVDETHRLAGMSAVAQAALATAYGQDLDTQNLQGEDNYLRVVRANSTPFYGTVLNVGGLLAGAPHDTCQGLYERGVTLGEIIQVSDDLLDAFACPAGPDWYEGRNNLALLYTMTADHPDRARFKALQPLARQPDQLRQAQMILIRSGAVSYCIYRLLARYDMAKHQLKSLALARSDLMASGLNGQVFPVARWLSKLGLDIPPGLAAETA